MQKEHASRKARDDEEPAVYKRAEKQPGESGKRSFDLD
jgi:hypothetical protein